MIVNYWAGTFTAGVIMRQPDAWAYSWAKKAIEAERQGRVLAVFAVPQINSAEIIQLIEGELQDNYGELPPGLIMPQDL
jgi:hypothetical protein